MSNSEQSRSSALEQKLSKLSEQGNSAMLKVSRSGDAGRVAARDRTDVGH